MNKNAMAGVEFLVSGVVNTSSKSYIILVDRSSSAYFPINSEEIQSSLIEAILSDEAEFCIDNFGLYFSFLSMFKAHGMFPTQVVLVVGKDGTATCSMDVVEDNELGVKVSRIPMVMSDAIVVASLGKIPIVVYGEAGIEFAFKIDEAIPKQNVFSFICEEIVRSERMSALGSSEN